MLKKLLKYEFKATARTYGGMYLALLAASVLFGGSVWIYLYSYLVYIGKMK